MRLLFAGTPETAATVLEGLISSGHEVVAILTREDAMTGRKKQLTPSPVSAFASKNNIPTIKANALTAEVLQEIMSYRIDLAVVVAYGVILRQDALDALPTGWFNLHFSKLPDFRGAAPVQHAIRTGALETAVTLFKIDEGLDTGPTLGFAETAIGPDETAGELLKRLSMIGLSLLNQELPKLYSHIALLSQQSAQSTSAPKITRPQARIQFSQSSQDIHNLVRAMNPEPMAWCLLGDQVMRILRTREMTGTFALDDGEIALVDNKVVAGCDSGSALELLEVQPASRTVMSAKDWYNGHHGKIVLS